MIKGMTLSKGGSRLPLILGLILGLVAAVLVVVYLTSAKDEGSSTSSGTGDFPVVVAKQSIAANVKITPEMVEVRTVPQADAITGAISTTEGLVGKVTRVAIVANEQISDTKVFSTDSVIGCGANCPLSLLVEPGRRAISTEMSALIGAGGNIRPGDYVDVILIVELKVTGPNGESNNDIVAGT